MLAVLRRELWTTFASPRAWLVLALFLLVQGYNFALLVELSAHPAGPHGPVLRHFFGGTFVYWLFLIALVCLLTMGLFAPERRSGTLQMLLSTPLSEAELVIAKYLSSLIFFAFLWSPTLLYLVVIRRLFGGADWGPVAAGYLGTFVVGGHCLALGLLCSALSRSQLLAGLLTFVVLCSLLLLGPLQHLVRQPTVLALVRALDLFSHMEEFAQGIVDSRRLVLHLGLPLLWLTAAAKALEKLKWR